MEVKKKYAIGDTVWIYGISRNKNTKGKIIAKVDLSSAGYNSDIEHYVVSVPSSIEPLLEIRTWETISQDESGPVGALRELGTEIDAEHKKVGHVGYDYVDDQDDPTPDEIMAALEKSSSGLTHKPLHIKDNKPKKKYYPRKKKL